MLTWQGTDDDGNFEISRADAAVLAMSGLCGLDPDRIPACAAVTAAEVQAAYDRGYDNGFDDGLDAATPTGSTPPPVTAPPAPATAAERCDAHLRAAETFPPHKRLQQHRSPFLERQHIMNWGDTTYNGAWREPKHVKSHDLFSHNTGVTVTVPDSTIYEWRQRYADDFEGGQICAIHILTVQHFPSNPGFKTGFQNIEPDGEHISSSLHGVCWVTIMNPISGLEQEVGFGFGRYGSTTTYSALRDADVRGAIAGDRPSPDRSSYNPADCRHTYTPGKTWTEPLGPDPALWELGPSFGVPVGP